MYRTRCYHDGMNQIVETLQGWRGPLQAFLRSALDLLLPPRCLGCGDRVGTPGTLCPTCWTAMHFIDAPFCACCGLPFDYDAGAGALCGACIAAPPQFGRARAVLSYDDASRPLILGFKHGDRTDAAPGFARWMARSGATLLAECDVIAAVPLHRWRLLRRRYNQSALLALHLGRVSGKPVVPDLLIRRRATPSQGGLTAKGRARNVAGAFAAHPRHRDRISGARVLLVDDVLTTGATVGECARVLRRAGAVGVDVLTLARVPKPVRLDPIEDT
ncbi:ComF family protein [Niveispirillum sp. BGYR6]|uniref:ComF family protein n=1 Tax=Niveispirillum sp. BGYR6 TaxID=2971249 RepID=UPI0022B95447|nr:ComF family protein [Niveispirillum sp. BGYR6]MDG5495805.1 ComF family protein [Niveispirillum sp. BGYR6]